MLNENPSDRNARNNLLVLKNKLARLGGTTSAYKKAASPTGLPNAAKDDNSTAGVVLLSPGFKQSSHAPTATEQATTSSQFVKAQTVNDGSGPVAASTIPSGLNAKPHEESNAIILPSQILTRTSGSVGTIKEPASPSNTAYGAMPNNTSTPAPAATASTSPAASISTSTTPPAASTLPAASESSMPAAITSANPAGSRSSMSLESTLDALETKVYGSTKNGLPILKRLESLERDTNARTTDGSIAERIRELVQTYGL